VSDKQQLAAKILSGDLRPFCPSCGSTSVAWSLQTELSYAWSCLACNHVWEAPVVHERPVTYLVSIWPEACACPDAATWCLTVARRSGGKWAVLRGDGNSSMCLGIDGQFTPDYIPSVQARDEWLASHRFTLKEALRVANFYAASIVVAGMTAAEALAAHQKTFPEGCNA
jgi:hypothetical protein